MGDDAITTALTTIIRRFLSFVVALSESEELRREVGGGWLLGRTVKEFVNDLVVTINRLRKAQ